MKNGGYYGSIDIGTNAARMVIKNIYIDAKGQIGSFKVQELRVPLRLGVDVFRYGKIQEKKLSQLIDTVSCFSSLFNIYGVIDYRAFATSAMREASNGSLAIAKIKEKTGVQVSIISGEQEASTISKIAKELKLGDDSFIFVDVGGGSTEITLYTEGTTVASTSFPLGTLRILARADKQESWDNMKKLLSGYRSKYGNMNIVGTGGNINRYWKLSEHKTKKGNNVLSIDALKKEFKNLKSLSLSDRMSKYSLKPDRADVIIPAGDIFLLAAEILHSDYIVVPMVGLGDGIVDLLVQQDMDVI